MLGKIFDAQATLVNQMAAKSISLGDKNDEDLKMIGVSYIDSFLVKLRLMKKGLEKSQL